MNQPRDCEQDSRTAKRLPRLPTDDLSALKPPRPVEKTYHGRVGRGGVDVWVEETCQSATNKRGSVSCRPLPPHLEVRDHSPTGFAWGYGGSGPAQLALALLVDATGNEELALAHYQDFKREFVSWWKEEWSITVDEIRAFVTRAKEPERPRRRSGRPWFEVDKQGLARILERKGKAFALFELVQNAWDEPGVTQMNVTLARLGRHLASLVVEDDAPEGSK